MATVIEDFLVNLGFSVNKNSEKTFRDATIGATSLVKALGHTFLKTGVEMTKAFLKGSVELGNLYNVSNNLGASVTGIMDISKAIESVGGSSDMAKNAIGQLAYKLKYLPDFGRSIEQTLGVNLTDEKTGKIKDLASVLLIIRNRLAELNKQGTTGQAMAMNYAQFLGIGDAFEFMMKEDFAKNLQKFQENSRAFGDSIRGNAKQAQKLRTELSVLGDTLHKAFLDTVGEINKMTAFDETLARWNKAIPAFTKSAIEELKTFFSDTDNMWENLSKKAEKLSGGVLGFAKEKYEKLNNELLKYLGYSDEDIKLIKEYRERSLKEARTYPIWNNSLFNPNRALIDPNPPKDTVDTKKSNELFVWLVAKFKEFSDYLDGVYANQRKQNIELMRRQLKEDDGTFDHTRYDGEKKPTGVVFIPEAKAPLDQKERVQYETNNKVKVEQNVQVTVNVTGTNVRAKDIEEAVKRGVAQGTSNAEKGSTSRRYR